MTAHGTASKTREWRPGWPCDPIDILRSLRRGAGDPTFQRDADGLCVAVGAHASELEGIGVDVEVDRTETSTFARRICKEPELSAIRRLGASVEALAPVVFSAKEASYKLQFPLTRDASAWGRIEVLLSTDAFTVRIHGGPGLLADGRMRGRWRRALGFVWAGVTLPVANWSPSR